MKEEVYFSSDELFDVISEILKENGLEESLIDSANKIAETGTSWATIIFRITKELAKGNIGEKDFIISLQNQLSIPAKTAENIAEDIKEKILPFAQRVEIENYDQKQDIEKKSTTITPIRPITERQSNNNNIQIPNQKSAKAPIKAPADLPKSAVKRQKIIKNINKLSDNKEIKNPTKKQDSYREPIE